MLITAGCLTWATRRHFTRQSTPRCSSPNSLHSLRPRESGWFEPSMIAPRWPDACGISTANSSRSNMRYVILRDDDTSALTPVECLERLYRPFLDRGLPVNLATIPKVRTDTIGTNGLSEGYLVAKDRFSFTLETAHYNPVAPLQEAFA